MLTWWLGAALLSLTHHKVEVAEEQILLGFIIVPLPALAGQEPAEIVLKVVQVGADMLAVDGRERQRGS